MKKERKIGIKTFDELKEFCSLFGLSVRITKETNCNVLSIVSSDGHVAVCEPWNTSYDYSEKLMFPSAGEFTDRDFSFIVSSVVTSLSTKRFLKWKTSNVGVIPFGTEKTTVETKIDLPDFSSVAELRIMMAASGASK